MRIATSGFRERRVMELGTDAREAAGHERNVYQSRPHPTFEVISSDSYGYREMYPNNLYVCTPDRDTPSKSESLIVVMFGRERVLSRKQIAAALKRGVRDYLVPESEAKTGLISAALSWMTQEDAAAMLHEDSLSAQDIVEGVFAEYRSGHAERLCVRVLAVSRHADAYGSIDCLADLESALMCIPTAKVGGWEIEELYCSALESRAFTSSARNAKSLFAHQQLPLGCSYEVLRHQPFVEEMLGKFCEPTAYRSVQDRSQWVMEFLLSCEIYSRTAAGQEAPLSE